MAVSAHPDFGQNASQARWAAALLHDRPGFAKVIHADQAVDRFLRKPMKMSDLGDLTEIASKLSSITNESPRVVELKNSLNNQLLNLIDTLPSWSQTFGSIKFLNKLIGLRQLLEPRQALIELFTRVARS